MHPLRKLVATGQAAPSAAAAPELHEPPRSVRVCVWDSTAQPPALVVELDVPLVAATAAAPGSIRCAEARVTVARVWPRELSAMDGTCW